MKKLLLIAALVAAPAFADSWAMPNRAGGEIVLTDRKCPGYPKLLEAYNYTDSGSMQTGCWTVVDDMVHVVWDKSGKRYTYPLESFYTKSTNKKGAAL
jgi:hypothetical protein